MLVLCCVSEGPRHELRVFHLIPKDKAAFSTLNLPIGMNDDLTFGASHALSPLSLIDKINKTIVV